MGQEVISFSVAKNAILALLLHSCALFAIEVFPVKRTIKEKSSTA